MAQDIGTGTTLTFDSGFFAQVTSVSWSVSRESVETTHMGTSTARTYKETDLFDPGELGVEGFFDPATRPPIDNATETCTVNWAGAGSGSQWAASAFMTSFEIGSPQEEMMTFSATLKLTGDITIS